MTTSFRGLQSQAPISDDREQYLRDLEVLERCERCIEEQAGCPDFFGCMGEISAGRGGA